VIVNGTRLPLSPWFWRNLALGLAVVGVGMGALAVYAHLNVDPLADAQAYYLAATRLNEGQPLYPPWLDPSGPTAYFYPPLLAVVLRPFAATLSFEAFRIAWEAVILASFALLVIRLGLTRRTALAVAILGMPIAFTLSVAQAHAPLTLLLAIGSPWSIALATNVKIFPALVAVYWLGRRDWAALRRFAAWLVVLAAVQLVLEPTGSLDYLGALRPAWLGEVRNMSPYALSPILWAVLAVAGLVAALRLAPTRWGWASAVALSTLVPPRLLSYMFMGLLATLGGPKATAETPTRPVEPARPDEPPEPEPEVIGTA